MCAAKERPHVCLNAAEASEQLVHAVAMRDALEPGAHVLGTDRRRPRGRPAGDKRSLDSACHLQDDPVRRHAPRSSGGAGTRRNRARGASPPSSPPAHTCSRTRPGTHDRRRARCASRPAARTTRAATRKRPETPSSQTVRASRLARSQPPQAGGGAFSRPSRYPDPARRAGKPCRHTEPPSSSGSGLRERLASAAPHRPQGHHARPRRWSAENASDWLLTC